MRQVTITILLCCAFAFTAKAQFKDVREGNKLYEKGNYKAAADAYQKALSTNPTDAKSLFNLGNALYQQKQYEAARKALNATAKTSADKAGKSAANYNTGNTYMHEQKWQEAIESYKQALRNNPQDADAKYNLSYAQAMLKKQQGEGGGKNDKNKDKNEKDKNKDQNKDQQNKDDKQNQDKQDQKDQNQQNQDKQDKKDENKGEDNKPEENKDKKEEEKKQPQPSKLSDQQAEQLLNALQQEEKKLMDKMQKRKATPVRVEKDW